VIALRAGRLAGAIAVLLVAAGCAAPAGSTQPSAPAVSGVTVTAGAATNGPTAATMTLTSGVFAEGEAIPKQFTCDGENVSPSLGWDGLPAGTVSLALIVHDPDASSDFVHWVVSDINPAAFSRVPVGWSGTSDAASEGDNDRGDPGWTGPCPPSGTHHYVFRLLALDTTLQLRAGSTADDVLAAAGGHILGEATLTGTYARS